MPAWWSTTSRSTTPPSTTCSSRSPAMGPKRPSPRPTPPPTSWRSDMSTTTLDPRATAPEAVAPVEPGWRPRATAWLRDVVVLARRNLVHVAREPAQLSDATVQPVLFTVLFVYIFGVAMVLPGGGSYKDFAIGGLVTMN